MMKLSVKVQEIPIEKIVENIGQIPEVPANPRRITDEAFELLKKSIEESPEMREIDEVKVFPFNGQFVTIGGNHRLRAYKELSWKKVLCKILPEDTPPEKLREYIMKENMQYAQNDPYKLQSWGKDELEDWGVELPNFDEEGLINEAPRTKTETERLSEVKFVDCYYTPVKKPEIELKDCIDTELFNKKVDIINKSKLPQELKSTMKMLAYRFIKIDFESIANYYAYNATTEEKRIIERLRCVLVDGAIDGFFEDRMLRVNDHFNETTDD